MSDENLREITISSAPVIFSPYTNNRVSCCRYSWLNFLPKSIYYQFSNIALIYFVFLCIIDFYSSSSYSISSSLVIPLLILILFNLIKDAIYMISCKRQDEHLNSKLFRVWNGVEFLNTRSDKILVGHIIKIYEGQKAPADILILCSANNNGSFYVDFTEAIGISDIKNNYEHELCSHLSLKKEISPNLCICQDLSFVEIYEKKELEDIRSRVSFSISKIHETCENFCASLNKTCSQLAFTASKSCEFLRDYGICKNCIYSQLYQANGFFNGTCFISEKFVKDSCLIKENIQKICACE